MLSAGANVNSTTDSFRGRTSVTPLQMVPSAPDGGLPLVKLLLSDKRVDPSAMDSMALYNASANVKDCTEIVKLLLSDKRVDPSVKADYALRMASGDGHAAIVQLNCC